MRFIGRRVEADTSSPILSMCSIRLAICAPRFSLARDCATFSEMFPAWNPSQPEITDLIVQYDSGTLRRLPVRKRQVLEVFSRFHNRRAFRAVQHLPEKAGILDDREIDALLLTVHWEMQRLAEE